MIVLTHFMRDRLVVDIANYPALHYETDVQLLTQQLTANHRTSTDYIITFGHVLVQAHTHSPDAILNFARVIAHIVELMNDQSNCALVAADAHNWSIEFTEGWNALLSSLEQAGVGHETLAVLQSAKAVKLFIAR